MTRRWRIALALSVALNLFLVAGTAAFLIGRHHGPPGFHREEHRRFEETRARDERSGFETLWADQLPEIRSKFRAIGEQRRAVGRAFAAEPFDPAGLREAFSTLRERQQDAQRALHAAMTEAAAKLSHEERKRLYEAAVRRFDLRPRDPRPPEGGPSPERRP